MKILLCHLSALLLLLGACAREPEQARFNKSNFSNALATVTVVKGRVLVGNSPTQVFGMALVGAEPVTTGQGEAEVLHDNGVRFILSEGARVMVQPQGLALESGNAWVEFPRGLSADCTIAGFRVRSRAASLDVRLTGEGPGVYVFNGEVLAEKDGARFMVKEGNMITLGAKPAVSPIAWWDSRHLAREWKREGALELVPGQGVLGARRPGSSGKAHLPLVISSMDVKVSIIGDMAVTEVKQQFLNPSRETLEGIYRFQAPEGALVTGFAVDRSGKLVFGRIKGKELAKQQYTSNVYQGSTEDPALLEWEDFDRYKAFIYPINPGQKRTIFIRYSSWLPRRGATRNLRTYHLPLIGYDDLSPEYGEFNLVVRLGKSWAGKAMANMGAKADGSDLVIRESDFRTTADFNLVLADGGVGKAEAPGYYGRPLGRNPPPVRRDDFIFARVWPFSVEEEQARSVDLVILVDMSADSSAASLNLARLAVENAVKTLKNGDKVAIVTGDLSLRKGRKYVEIGKGDPVAMLEELASESRGGATDITALLKQTAEAFSSTVPGRAPILLYVGNGRPTVGEVKADTVAKKWFQLPHFIGFRAIATEDGEGVEILKRLSGGREPLMLSDPTVIRHLPAFINSFRLPRLKHVQVNAGGTVSKVFPHPQTTFEYEGREPILVVGQLSEGTLPREITVTAELDGKSWKRTFTVNWGRFTDTRELARRYGAEKLSGLMEEGASSEVLMDLGLRYGLVTPYTSLYVPTEREAKAEGLLLQDADGETDDQTAGKNLTETSDESEKSKDKAKKMDTGVARTKTLKTFGNSNAVAAAEPKAAQKEERSIYKKVRRPRRRAHKRSPRMSGKKSGYRGSTGSSSGFAAPPTSMADRAPSPAKPIVTTPAKRPDGRVQRLYSTSVKGHAGIGIGGGGGLGGRFGKMGGQGRHRARVIDGDITINGPAPVGGELAAFQVGNTFIANTMIFCVDCKWQRKPSPCSPVSKLPLWQRRNMWRERMGGIYPYKALEAYNDALRMCEIPGPSSRRVFLRLAVAMLGNVRNLVQFYRIFTPHHGHYTFLKSAIIAAVSSVGDLLYVKRMLGIGLGYQRAKIEELVEKAKTGKEKIAIVRRFIEKGEKDPWLSIKLLNLLEETRNRFQAGRLIDTLFGNPLLDEELRLEAVEYLIRIKDRTKARRLLSEIVEFAPSSPLRRKILGSLYRAFGEARFAVREFTSLLTLTASSHESMILLALAWEDAGAHEKALDLYSKVMTQGDPESGLVKLARILASAHLARMRLKASPAEKTVILQKGRKMALYRNDESVKILLTYKHPKADLELLWGETEADLRRVSFLKPRWGVEGLILSKIPGALTFKVVRGAPGSRRVLDAEFLIILNEGTEKEKILRQPLVFKDGLKEVSFSLEKGTLTMKKGEAK